MSSQAVTSIDLQSLTLVASGKVRELYQVNECTLLMVVTDRVSAYDKVLFNGIPDKGTILCQISAHWFTVLGARMSDFKHHLLSLNPPSGSQVVSPSERAVLRGRCMQIRALKVFPIEVIVRGYITGSAWDEYEKHSTVHGIPQPAGLQRCQAFPEGPIYTPSTKAPPGSKDENISPDEAREIVGERWARKIESLALNIYKTAHTYAMERGIVIADTKMEFGFDEENDEVVVVDELLSPDSSRFWPAPVQVGEEQPSFDKQHIRDYLKAYGLDGKSDVELPENIVHETTKTYREVFRSENRGAAATEKAYLFIVVNGYENIKDKERCQKMILEQVRWLSPQTCKESSQLVHFVSSNAIPTAPPPGGDGARGSLSEGGGDDPDFDGDSDSKGKEKAKDEEKIRDLEILEQSLRKFVLEKRARSKLAPAKTYLLNVLTDVHTLATVNQEVAQSELDRVFNELKELEPVLEASKRAKAEVNDNIDQTIENTCREVYEHTRSTLNSTESQAAEDDLGVPYPGLLNIVQYADEIKDAILSQISVAVDTCEKHARMQTVEGVNMIRQLGILHLGNEYTDIIFRSDVMLRREKDVLARQIEIKTEFWDFFEWHTILRRQEKVAETGMALTIITAVGGRIVDGFGLLDGALGAAKVVRHNNLRKLIVPGVIITAIATVAYIISQIPHSLSHRLTTKISTQLASTDYVHANCDRIASFVRKVLRFPADNLRVGLQRSIEQLGSKREETTKIRGESEVARKYFGNLVNESARIRNTVEAVDLEGPAPDVAAGRMWRLGVNFDL